MIPQTYVASITLFLCYLNYTHYDDNPRELSIELHTIIPAIVSCGCYNFGKLVCMIASEHVLDVMTTLLSIPGITIFLLMMDFNPIFVSIVAIGFIVQSDKKEK